MLDKPRDRKPLSDLIAQQYQELVRNSKHGHDEYGQVVIIRERTWDNFVRFICALQLGIELEEVGDAKP
jgi:hypothetical protein